MVGTMRKSPILTSAEWSQIEHIGSPDALGYQTLQQGPKSVDAKIHYKQYMFAYSLHVSHYIFKLMTRLLITPNTVNCCCVWLVREEEEKESLCLVQIQLLWVCISYASCCRDQMSGRDQCKGEKDEGVVCRDGEGRVTRAALDCVSRGSRLTPSRPGSKQSADSRVRMQTSRLPPPPWPCPVC